jgi:anionic cell wall polymer biosynthesis LytR-Cps2A-Psr (LCP) family protein
VSAARQGSAALGILDRDGWAERTDNLVVADARRRRLVWIPRDLWSAAVGDRVNEAFARGGHAMLHAALRELGHPVEASLVLLRSAVERAFETLRITVPVDRPRHYWYPLAPTQRLQDGAKRVAFEPPEETLVGERLHQWVGARTSADPSPPKLPDFDRIERQQVLVRRLLQESFDFARALEDPARVSASDARALEALGRVRADWRMTTLDRVEPATIDGKKVLIRRRPWPLHLLARARR